MSARDSAYLERLALQLEAWVGGTSQHNTVDDECCPDFSCCRPALARPLGERAAFLSASRARKHELLAMYLQALVDSMHGNCVNCSQPNCSNTGRKCCPDCACSVPPSVVAVVG